MELKKNPKVNLNRWSPIFFLTGLAIMLAVSLWMMEFKSYDKAQLSSNVVEVGDELENDIPITDLITPPPPPPPPVAAVTVIEVVADDADVEEIVIESTEADQNTVIVDVQQIEYAEEEEEEIVNVPFAVIEDVPIYPGCEQPNDREAKRKCLAEKVMKFVQKNFNTDLAGDLGLEGKQRISVTFKIDENGNIANVRARAPHPLLEKEAIRVVNTLPKMTPGKQRGKPVGVLYSLPILFQVEMHK